jgi:hypothetical protein
MSELYKTMPDMVLRLYGWEEYSADSLREQYFFLSEFIDMHNSLLDPGQLCRKLAQLHQKSVSLTGMFGLYHHLPKEYTSGCIMGEQLDCLFHQNHQTRFNPGP